MKDLGPTKARLARLGARVGCRTDHLAVKVSHCWQDYETGLLSPEPEPWPPADAPTHCDCGAKIHYRHVVEVYQWEGCAAAAWKADVGEGEQ